MKKLLPLLALCALFAGCKPSNEITDEPLLKNKIIAGPASSKLVGDPAFHISILLDGTNSLENALFTGDASIIKKFAPDGHTPVACNVLLVKPAFMVFKPILIDTGYGGDLLAQLKTHGLSPENIGDILITHTHFDHVGGLMTTNGTAAFPNATLHITAAELEFWKNSKPPLANPELATAVEKAYKIEFITPDGKTPVANPYITAIDVAGHTPGHVVFRFGWENAILFAGDILHSELLQFAHPEIYPVFDNDKDAAHIARTNILTRAAENNWTFYSSHVTRSGKIVKDGEGFKLVER